MELKSVRGIPESDVITCRNQRFIRPVVPYRGLVPLLTMVFLSAMIAPATAQLDFEQAPINYGKAPTHDAVTRLQKQLDAGQVTLEHDEQHGYLKSLLELLDVPVSSQVLVYSKTSFQLRRISPRTPRALYFNDESHVGWVQRGEAIEIMATDPQQGEIFYTLSQTKSDHPKFVRDQGQCIICHASSRTEGVPGGLVRSVVVNSAGRPQFGAGTFTIDHRSPFDRRWGGWYVTGTHGAMRHMGNVFATSRVRPEELDREAGANMTDLTDRFDTEAYLTPHSDVVALMVLEHQTRMQNLITRASHEARSAAHHDGIMNAALDRPADHVSDTTRRRVQSVSEKLVKYLLFAEEFTLTSPVRGTSDFAEQFTARGPKTADGRSLRDFDLQTRMFRYPCSYLIYSKSFDELPAPVRQHVITRLDEVLTGEDQSEDFAHLSEEDRRAIREILLETKPGLWKQSEVGPAVPAED